MPIPVSNWSLLALTVFMAFFIDVADKKTCMFFDGVKFFVDAPTSGTILLSSIRMLEIAKMLQVFERITSFSELSKRIFAIFNLFGYCELKSGSDD